MIRPRLAASFPPAILAVLGILAACDVNDSPRHAGSPTVAAFAPRVLAPAGGFRKADWLTLSVWKQNGVGGWDSLYFRDSIAPTKPSVSVKVPLSVKLRYRIAGYIVSFTGGLRTTDTVWSAEESGFILYDSMPVSKSAATQARNWAVSPTSLTSPSAVFIPGNTAAFRTGRGELVAARLDSSVSCTDARDSVASVSAPIGDSLRVWVIACGADASVVPTKPRRYAWAIDTTTTADTKTPIAPVVSGNSGFASGQNLPSSQTDPTARVQFSAPAGARIAWDFRLDDAILAFPDSSEFPAVPKTLAEARFLTDSAKLDLWSRIRDSVGGHPAGFRVLVTTTRIDTSLGRSWVSSPTRFWFTVTPPPTPSRFGIAGARWDSVAVDWDLSTPGLTYQAWHGIGTDIPDVQRATQVPADRLTSTDWGIGALPADTSVTVLLRATDPRTGFSSQVKRTAKTLVLPSLPAPRLRWPNTDPATIKKSSQDTLAALWAADSAGRPLRVRYGWTRSLVASTPDPMAVAWPDLSQAASTTLSSDSAIHPGGAPGDYVYLSFATEDAQGRRSATIRQLLTIVADDADVPPDAPRGLHLVARSGSSLLLAWDSLPGFSYRVRYRSAGQGLIEADIDSAHFAVTGLAVGTKVDSIAVLARQISNPSRQSGWSQPSVAFSTRNPPPAPPRATAEWILDGGLPKLRWRWTRTAGTTDSFAVVGLSDTLAAPGSVAWKAPSSSQPGPDSLDIPYGSVPTTPFLAFGLRAVRDSVASTPVWAIREIPIPAPKVDPSTVRVWQFGDVWKFAFSGTTHPANFVLKVQVSQVLGTSSSFASTVAIPGASAVFSLDSLQPGAAGARFYWERKPAMGIPVFDRGEEYFVAKTILPPPSGFTLTPAPTDGEWTFQAPANLANGAEVVLHRSNAQGASDRPIKTGETVAAAPAAQDTFQIAQIVGEDTSALSPGQGLAVLPAPRGNPIPSSYLFPFDVTISGQAPQYQLNGTWIDARTPVSPSSFPDRTIPVRDIGPFAMSPVNKLAYVFDSTFDDPDWEKRVINGVGVVPGKGWVGSANATMSWVAGDGRNPSYIKVAQTAVGSPGIVGFATNYSGGTTYDASGMGGATIGVTTAGTKISYAFVIGSSAKGGIPVIYVPATISATGSTGTTLLADFFPAATATQPFTLDSKGTSTPVTATQMTAALAASTWLGVAVSGTSTLTASMVVTSIHLVSNRSRF